VKLVHVVDFIIEKGNIGAEEIRSEVVDWVHLAHDTTEDGLS
jgi:hypothetical protein